MGRPWVAARPTEGVAGRHGTGRVDTTNGRQRRAPTPGADTDAHGQMVPQPFLAAAGEGCSTRAARRRAGSRPSSTSALTRAGACGRAHGDEDGAGGTRPLLHGRARAQGRGTAGDSGPATDSHWRSERGLPQAGEEGASVAPEAAVSKEPKKERMPRVDQAELLRRTFDLDVFTCAWCGGRRRVLAYVKGARGVRAILEHLGLPTAGASLAPAPQPPPSSWCCGSSRHSQASLAPAPLLMRARPGLACSPRGCAAFAPSCLTARAAPIRGPPRPLRSSPPPLNMPSILLIRRRNSLRRLALPEPSRRVV
jgi:LSD1 subclass zinc finger protein